MVSLDDGGGGGGGCGDDDDNDGDGDDGYDGGEDNYDDVNSQSETLLIKLPKNLRQFFENQM